MVAEAGLDYLGFASYGVAAVDTGGKQSSTGALHLNGFSSYDLRVMNCGLHNFTCK